MLATRALYARLICYTLATCVAPERALAQTDIPTPIATLPPPMKSSIRAPTFGTVSSLSETRQGLSFALIPQETPYRFGSGIVVELYFNNKLRHPIYYDAKKITWTVTGPGKVHEFVHGDYPYGSYQAAMQGAHALTGVDLQDFITFPNPGTYTVTATVKMSRLNVELTSPPVSVTLVQARRR